MPTDQDPTKLPLPAKDDEPDLATEIKVFEKQCIARYTFNNAWDVALTAGGIMLGVSVAAAGVFDMSKTGAILGAVVTAAVSAQRAFPFTQRAQFYRSLTGQVSNLRTDLANNRISPAAAIVTIKSLRLDFAQQLPRGSSTPDNHPATNPNPPNDAPPPPNGNNQDQQQVPADQKQANPVPPAPDATKPPVAKPPDQAAKPPGEEQKSADETSKPIDSAAKPPDAEKP